MKIYLSLALLLLSSWAMAQHATIKGRITTSDGKAAEFVNVNLKGAGKGTVTNQEGEFLFEKVKAGNYALQVSFVGLETQTQSVSVTAGQVSDVNVVLKENLRQLEEVVVTAFPNKYNADMPSVSLRLKTPLIETPQNIQVLTKALINDQQIFDMLEGVTRNVSGVTRLEHWDNYALLNMRGSQIAAFRNGMNVQMPWGPLAEDMSMVESIEFVKGPAGFMMANGEPSGFYNVVTKKPTGITKGEMTLTLGSFDTYRATADFDGLLSKDGKLQYRLNVMGQMKGSHRDYEFNNRYSVVPVIKYKINDKTSLTAEYTYQYSQMSMIGSAYVFSQKPYEHLPVNFTLTEPNLDPTNINDHSLLLILNHQINKDWKLTGQLAYYNYNQIGTSMWPSSVKSDGTIVRGISIWDALGINRIGQIFVNGDVKTGGITHRILAGLDMGQKEYFADWAQSSTLKGAAPFNIYNPVYGTVPADSLPVFDRSKSLRSRGVNYGQSYSGLYVQDELRFWDGKIRLTLAGRYTTAKDYDPYSGSVKSSKFTPRIGMSISLNKSTSAYAMYDQAFIPQAGADVNGRSFDPITGNNTEAGLKKEWMGGRWNSTVSLYQITKNNVLTADPNNPNFSIQLGQTKTKGVEFDLRGQLLQGLDLTLNYAYTDAKVTKDTDEKKVGVAVAGATKHITNAWLSYRVSNGNLKGLGASLGYQWQVDRSSWYVFDGTNQALPNYFRLDGAVSWQSNRLTVALNVNNLLNEYLFSGAPYTWLNAYYWQTEPLRNSRLSIGYKF
ncbi:TonB-dependent siderophore receptor [Runella rosea]|uniref:TonB-dependent siderophore receptor n=1 Tax=Runella rosea TaxID=2259595 RepID=A0A344TRY0_9BACT|nr:TonB-dependent receptor [Runella rosea]AXE21401.1 TonB-dependent siderophore receptor [Runella rosea]